MLLPHLVKLLSHTCQGECHWHPWEGFNFRYFGVGTFYAFIVLLRLTRMPKEAHVEIGSMEYLTAAEGDVSAGQQCFILIAEKTE